MRLIATIVAIAILPLPCTFSQTQGDAPSEITVNDLPDLPGAGVQDFKTQAAELAQSVADQFAAGYQVPKFRIVISDKKIINAMAYPSINVIELPLEMVQFLANDRGELAFVVAHELGHIQDRDCATRGVKQRLSALANSRMCEATADYIGIQYMMGAGYSPFDAAAFMGRLMMASGDTTVLGSIVGRFMSDHPVGLDRIARIRDDARRVCIDRPDICAHFKQIQ